MNRPEPSEAARLRELDAEYQILGELGRGGTSVVYRARERELGREVAIKVVRATHVDDKEVAARLAREARLVAALRHPNIVPLLGVRRLSDGLALIMQYVPGRTLRRAIREQGRMPIALVEHVLRQLAGALDYAHKRHGIVHRDIKPENIYLDEDLGHVLLADFGIARSTESESTLTLAGTALGTPAYMSPEQIDGDRLDGRSDLYSLGLVAYEMLTGRQPWAGQNLYTIIYKQKHEELPHISEFRTDVPHYLLNALDSLLRKSAAERCADGVQLLALLSGAAPAPINFAASGPAQPVEVVGEDLPTLRYQRPTLTEDDEQPTLRYHMPLVPPPVAEPVEASVSPLTPALPDEPHEMPALAAAASNVPDVQPADDPGEPIETAPEPASVAAVVEAADEAELVPAREARAVVVISVLLVLIAAATVVAMIKGPDEPTDGVMIDNPAITQTQPNENAEAALLRAAGTLPEFQSVSDTVQPPVDQSATAAAGAKKAATETAKAATRKPATAKTETRKPETRKKEGPRERKATPVRAPQKQNAPSPTPAQPAATSDLNSAGLPSLPRGSADGVVEPDPNVPAYTPRTTEPQLQNRPVVERALLESYTPLIREQRIAGTVILWVLVDTAGRVRRAEIFQSSGADVLDRAATRVVNLMEFTPALNGERKVGAWIKLPIQFQ